MVAREKERARPCLNHVARAGNRPLHRHQVAAVEHERAVIDDVTAAKLARRPAVANLQRAAADRGRARVGVGAREDGRAASHLVKVSAATDDAVERELVLPVEGEHAVVAHVADQRPTGAAVSELQRASLDRRAARIRVRASKNQRPGTHLLERPGAAESAADRQRVAAVEGERAVVDEGARTELPGGAAVSDLERAALDRRRSGVAVRTGQDGRAAAALHERASPADRAAERHGVRPIEDQKRFVADVAAQAAARAAIAHLQRSRSDRRAAAVGVGPRQHRRPRADLLERTGAADASAQLQQAVAIDDEAAVVDDRTRAERAGQAAVSNLQRRSLDRRAARISVVAREDERARTNLSQEAAAGDVVADRDHVTPVERQDTVIGDRAQARAGRSSNRCRPAACRQ